MQQADVDLTGNAYFRFFDNLHQFALFYVAVGALCFTVGAMYHPAVLLPGAVFGLALFGASRVPMMQGAAGTVARLVLASIPAGATAYAFGVVAPFLAAVCVALFTITIHATVMKPKPSPVVLEKRHQQLLNDIKETVPTVSPTPSSKQRTMVQEMKACLNTEVLATVDRVPPAHEDTVVDQTIDNMEDLSHEIKHLQQERNVKSVLHPIKRVV